MSVTLLQGGGGVRMCGAGRGGVVATSTASHPVLPFEADCERFRIDCSRRHTEDTYSAVRTLVADLHWCVAEIKFATDALHTMYNPSPPILF